MEQLNYKVLLFRFFLTMKVQFKIFLYKFQESSSLLHLSLILSFFTFIFNPLSGQTTIFVNKFNPGITQDGTSWNTAFSSLQDALAIADDSNEIWVTAGTYLPDEGSDREKSFKINKGVKIYGGFYGTETSLDERNFNENITILSGDIGIPTDSTDNSYSIIYLNHPDSQTIVDGFTIENGFAFSDNPLHQAATKYRSGGGIYILGAYSEISCQPQIRNCTFRNNYANAYGGAVCTRSSNLKIALPDFFNCSFIKNNSGTQGGAVHVFGFESQALGSFKFESCIFQYNSSISGGAIYFNSFYNNVEVTNTTFIQNEGGAFRSYSANSAFFENCKFELNFSGSAIHGGFQDLFLHQTIFEQNSSNDVDQIIKSASIGSINTFEGCTFSKNTSDNGIISLISNSSNIISNCLFFNNESTSSSILNLANTNSKIVNSTFFNNISLAVDDRLIKSTNSSSVIANSIFEKNFLSSNPIQNLAVASGSTTFFIDNNLIDIENCQQFMIDFSPNPISSVFCEDNIFNLSPLFTDPSAFDFSLQDCSPAINKGDNEFSESLSDIILTPRICNGTVDIGAFEHPAVKFTVLELMAPSCFGKPDATVLLEVENGCPPFTFTGGNNIEHNGSLLTNLPSGNHQLIYSDHSQNLDTLNVFVPETPELKLTGIIQDVPCAKEKGGMIIAKVSGGTPPYDFFWDGFYSIDSIAYQLPIGTYNLSITDANYCQTTKSFEVKTDCIIYIPNAFSPNDDGINDFFEIFPTANLESINKIEIFSRWGQLVFRQSNIDSSITPVKTWNGQLNGNPIPSGVYIYQIQTTLSNGEVKVIYGEVNLIR